MKFINKFILGILLTVISVSSYAGSVDCMAKAIYFESRGGTQQDMQSIGLTVMNRVNHSYYPNSVCAVVRQRSQYSPNIRRNSPIREPREWEKSRRYARQILNGQVKDFTNGATHFHTPAIRPRWSRTLPRVYRNNQHIFYRFH